VLGPWANRRWLNVIAGAIIGLLLVLSGTLVLTTLFPALSAPVVVVWTAAVLAAGTALAYGWLQVTAARRGVAVGTGAEGGSVRAAAARAAFAKLTPSERARWRMPPLALLKPVAWSPATKLTVAVMWCYLVVSVLLLIVKAVQLATG
jgi:hypothetical protein